MKVDGHKVKASVHAGATLGHKSASVKVTTEKAVIKAGDKEVTVVRKGHGDYEVKMHHVHSDEMTKKAARELGEKAIKSIRETARAEFRSHKH